MRLLIALWFALAAGACHAWVTFDGSGLRIPRDEWRELSRGKIPAPRELAAGINHFDWHRVVSHEALQPYQNKLLRADIRVRYSGKQHLLLVIPYAFIPKITIGVIRDGKVILWETLDSDMGMSIKRIHRSFGMLPLPITAPGDYHLLIRGNDIADSAIVHNTHIYLEENFVLKNYPLKVALAAAFIGAFATYLLLCFALLIYRYRPSFFYASIFLIGAFGSILLREGLLYLPWALDVSWWSKHVLPLAMGMTYGGVMLYVRSDLENTRWRRAGRALGVCGWVALAVSALNIFFPTRDYLWLGIFGLTFSVVGMIIGLCLVIMRAWYGNKRDIIFAIFFGSFFTVVLARTFVAIVAMTANISALPWYIAMDLLGLYILIEYLLTLTAEHVRDESRKSADLIRFDLVNRFSHELRTPLNAVIGLADLLKGSKEIGQVKSYADMIHAAGHTLLGLVNDILDFSKLGTSRRSLAERPFRLDRATSEVLYGFLPQSFETKIFSQSLIDPGLPFFLIGDELRLKQILANLISNALKYSEPGDLVTLQIHGGESVAGEIELLCSVSDNGVGIPEEKLETIFEPFTQVETADGKYRSGTGLGLAICKLLVEQMGGTISVESELGKGTRFYFNLWFKVDPDAPDLGRCFEALRDKRILVLSEFPSIRNQLTFQLEYWGAKITARDFKTELPAQEFDMILLETISREVSGCLPWLQAQPAATAIHLIQIDSPDWVKQLNHPNMRTMNVPTPLLTTLMNLSRHLGGECIDLEEDDNNETPTVLTHRNHCVLLVDDNTVNLTVGQKMLSSLHVDCDLACGGQEALARLHSGRTYSLVLLDCEMPDIDGFTVASEWRRYEATHGCKHLPIVAVTAHALAEVRDECLAVGMDDVIYKPIGRAALVNLLNAIPDKK